MDAADLDYRTRTLSGCIPPRLVTRLLDLGHAEEVEYQTGRGEWFCARAQAQLLAEQDRQAEALEVLAPYVATGWWTAVEAKAELLEGWGRIEEAIVLVRSQVQAGNGALDFFARLLARHGRGDEAFTLLRPHIDEWLLAETLVDVAEATGRDDEAAALLATRIAEVGHCDRCGDPSCSRRNISPSNAIDLLATIRERQGRIDDAIALLHTRDVTSVNNRDQLADLLARHDRIDELRTYAAADDLGHAAQRLAEVLEERGDVEGAIAVYRRTEDLAAYHVAVEFAELLARHGRGDEAIMVIRTLTDPPGGAEDWSVDRLCTLYADQGRAQEGLAYLDALKTRHGKEDWEFFRMRLPLLAACGRLDEAVEQARAHPEGDTWYAAWSLSELLADAGRTEEAVAVLEPHSHVKSDVLAWHLIGVGRVKDAVAVLQQPGPEPDPRWAEPIRSNAHDDRPPF